MFCEVSPELAAERRLVHGGWATITSRRAAIEARVLVTGGCKPMRLGGGVAHQVGLPYHWGSHGLSRGDAANDLFEIVLDPNVHIQESKAADLRHPAGPAGRRAVSAKHAPVSARPGRDELRRRGAGAHRVLHGHQRLHRLQGVRGRLQGVEPRPRGRPRLHRRLVRQHRRAGRQQLAPRRLRRAGAVERRRRAAGALADELGRLQALHARGLPRRLPDRRAVPHGARHRRRPGRRLQRLRLLRPGLSVRRASTSARSARRPRRASARSATTARGTA